MRLKTEHRESELSPHHLSYGCQKHMHSGADHTPPTDPTLFSKPFSFSFLFFFFFKELGTAQAGLQTCHIAEGDPEMILLPQITGFEP